MLEYKIPASFFAKIIICFSCSYFNLQYFPLAFPSCLLVFLVALSVGSDALLIQHIILFRSISKFLYFREVFINILILPLIDSIGPLEILLPLTLIKELIISSFQFFNALITSLYSFIFNNTSSLYNSSYLAEAFSVC